MFLRDSFQKLRRLLFCRWKPGCSMGLRRAARPLLFSRIPLGFLHRCSKISDLRHEETFPASFQRHLVSDGMCMSTVNQPEREDARFGKKSSLAENVSGTPPPWRHDRWGNSNHLFISICLKQWREKCWYERPHLHYKDWLTFTNGDDDRFVLISRSETEDTGIKWTGTSKVHAVDYRSPAKACLQKVTAVRFCGTTASHHWAFVQPRPLRLLCPDAQTVTGCTHCYRNIGVLMLATTC